MKEIKYQKNYSLLHDGRVLNEEKRFRKAEQIILIINHYVSKRMKNSSCNDFSVLDIGCSSGMIDFKLADHYKHITGIDIDKNALSIAKEKYNKENITYKYANIDEIEDETKYDLIVCNSVLEHVPNQEKLLDSIYKHLNEDGICFLSVPNKYTITKEPHYDLYFLSWLPSILSDIYLKLSGKGTKYYENPPSYYKLKRLCSKFDITNYTIERIKYPEKYALAYRVSNFKFISKFPAFLLRVLSLVSPSFVLILKKK